MVEVDGPVGLGGVAGEGEGGEMGGVEVGPAGTEGGEGGFFLFLFLFLFFCWGFGGIGFWGHNMGFLLSLGGLRWLVGVVEDKYCGLRLRSYVETSAGHVQYGYVYRVQVSQTSISALGPD